MNKVDKEIARIRNERYWRNIKLAMDGTVILIGAYAIVAGLVMAWESAKII